MEIFQLSRNVYDLVDAVVSQGYAAVHGSKSAALPMLERVRTALTAYPEVSACITYKNVEKQGYLYYMYDSEQLDPATAKRLIDELDARS